MQVKIQLSNPEHAVVIEATNLKMLQSCFPEGNVLTYIDEDGDTCTISSDAELAEALVHLKNNMDQPQFQAGPPMPDKDMSALTLAETKLEPTPPNAAESKPDLPPTAHSSAVWARIENIKTNNPGRFSKMLQRFGNESAIAEHLENKNKRLVDETITDEQVLERVLLIQSNNPQRYARMMDRLGSEAAIWDKVRQNMSQSGSKKGWKHFKPDFKNGWKTWKQCRKTESEESSSSSSSDSEECQMNKKGAKRLQKLVHRANKAADKAEGAARELREALSVCEHRAHGHFHGPHGPHAHGAHGPHFHGPHGPHGHFHDGGHFNRHFHAHGFGHFHGGPQSGPQ